jgi:hypothetical protein
LRRYPRPSETWRTMASPSSGRDPIPSR